MNDIVNLIFKYVYNNKPVKLNLGSGNTLKQGYINVDKRFQNKCFLDRNTNTLLIKYDMFKLIDLLVNDSVDTVKMDYVVEHIPFNILSDFFYELNNIMVKDGILYIITEDYDEIFRKMNEFELKNIDLLHIHVFCNEKESFHRSVWNERLAHHYLEREQLFKIKSIKKQTGTRNLGMKIIAKVIK